RAREPEQDLHERRLLGRDPDRRNPLLPGRALQVGEERVLRDRARCEVVEMGLGDDFGFGGHGREASLLVMKKAMRDFGEIERQVRRFRDERDWKQFHKPKDLAASVAIEAAELLEHFQWKTDDECTRYVAMDENRDAVAREMADVLILLVSAADVLGVDLHAA